MQKVEAANSVVYTENPSLKQASMWTIPFVIAISLMLFLGSYWIYMLIIGVFIPLSVGITNIVNQRLRGVRGISRLGLSAAISYLDMIIEGHSKIGRFKTPTQPLELSRAAMRTFGAAAFVVRKFDPEGFEEWINNLEQRLGSRLPRRSRLQTLDWGLGIMIVVLFAGAYTNGFGFGGMVMPVLALLAFVWQFAVLCCYAPYFLSTREKHAPEEIVKVISEVDINMQTKAALNKVVEVILVEGKYPLRVIVFGDYDGLTYTERHFTTSHELRLREAVLVPLSLGAANSI